MPPDAPDLSLGELARLHVLRGPQLMWLLGAGASAAAGVPTAGQMIDEFRRLIYSTLHGVPLAALNLAEPAVRNRIKRHFADHPDYPSPGDPDEYSTLFEAAWPAAADRRTYIDSKVAGGRPTFGNFGLAVLLAIGRGRIVWTTNFDRVIERAAELVLEPPAYLTIASLDTGDIAVQALAQDRFPLYVKLHGDFQSERLKNTAGELRDQDDRHRAALVQASQRYGLIVAGYSGRDASLMSALRDALDGGEPLPAGLFWCRRPGEDPAPDVVELLAAARDRGVDARWVAVHTFDELIGKLLLTASVPQKMQQILDQARPPRRREPFTIPGRRGHWPILRLNALQLREFPLVCRQVECDIEGTAAVREALQAVGARAVAARRSSGVIAFGYDDDLRAALQPYGIKSWALGSIATERLRRDGSGDLGLLYDALTAALARQRPLVARRAGGAHLLAIEPAQANDPAFGPLRKVLSALAAQRRGGVPGGGEITGRIGADGPGWTEAVRLRLAYHYDALWLVFEPVVWIEKSDALDRDLRTTFVGPRTWHRYNPVANELFDAWAKILSGGDGRCALYGINEERGIDAVFRLDERTGFSRAQGR